MAQIGLRVLGLVLGCVLAWCLFTVVMMTGGWL